MPNLEFVYDPALLGLPSREELVAMRIWDLHYHGIGRHHEVMPYFERMGVERVFSLDIARVDGPEAVAARNLEILEKEKHRVSGMVRIDPARVDATLEHMARWIDRGPCVGIKTGTRHGAPITVSHPNYDPIIRLAADLEAVIYIHTGFMVGGEPRTYYGGARTGESTPADVANLARRFPDVPLICGHQGADWELGVRAIRPHPNVYLEFSGMAPETGMVDFAVKELGADRLVWGCHAPSRSFANELSKIYHGELTREQRKKIFGTNLRKISASIHRRKGIPVEI